MPPVVSKPAEVALHRGYQEVVVQFLTELADDELTLGHRDSEWLGLAPDIEGDIAFSSIAQDEVGHAAFCFDRIAELTGQEADVLAFARPATERRNARLLERENGDWAETIVRHYLYDTFDRLRLQALVESSYRPLAEGAVKMLREEYYHRLHMQTVLARLGRGGEARERVERALYALADEVGSLFAGSLQDTRLTELGILTASWEDIASAWCEQVAAELEDWGLPVPAGLRAVRPAEDGRTVHGAALQRLLSEMAEVYSADPLATW